MLLLVNLLNVLCVRVVAGLSLITQHNRHIVFNYLKIRPGTSMIQLHVLVGDVVWGLCFGMFTIYRRTTASLRLPSPILSKGQSGVEGSAPIRGTRMLCATQEGVLRCYGIYALKIQ